MWLVKDLEIGIANMLKHGQQEMEVPESSFMLAVKILANEHTKSVREAQFGRR